VGMMQAGCGRSRVTPLPLSIESPETSMMMLRAAAD